jgi:hypothetical protein
MLSPSAPTVREHPTPIPTEGLFCPMCSSPVQARVPSPGATGLAIQLACLDSRDCAWTATVDVAWKDILPELSFDLGGAA